LAIGEDDSIIAVHGSSDMTTGNSVVDRLILRASENLVEVKLLRRCCRWFGVLRKEFDTLVG
jgi:hypothetical protein